MVVYGGRDLWKRYVFSLEWTNEGVIEDESGDGDGDEKEKRLESTGLTE